jgi:alpha-tubulin suppressor-like RCC1 family protein
MLGRELLAALLLLAGCMEPPALRDGVFRCDPADPGTCPPGYHCLRPAGSKEHRCFGEPGEGSCGNSKVEAGEECDGPYAGPRTCRDLGYFRGELTCGGDCRLETKGCVAMSAVSAGAYVSCGLDATGDAWCWGRKDQGQLGAAYVRSGPEPVAVNGGSGFSQVTVGREHACGVGPGGEVWCWGRNDSGQLGDGTTERQVVAILLPKPRLSTISAGHSHTCGLAKDGGRAWCWGRNDHGQLGTGKTSAYQLEPTEVVGKRRFKQLDAGLGHTCALDDQGKAWCWGYNSFGQLGDGSKAAHLAQPTAVAGGHSFKSISAGDYHTCAVTTSQQVMCWGRNTHGQLGDGTKTHRSEPVVAAGQAALVSVAAGTRHTCALQEDGVAWCWGHGPLGDGARGGSDAPVRVAGEVRLVSISAGDDVTCGSDGKTVSCWGWNGSWQLGSPRPVPDVPQPVVGSRTFGQLGTGEFHSCGLDGAGAAWCWGFNGFGNLGDGTFDGAREPVAVKGSLTFDALACGAQHSCGIDGDGKVWCWGNNQSGQLGSVTGDHAVSSPTPVSGLELVAISGGSFHSCGIDRDHKAWCWGDNSRGQLGVGSVATPLTPQPVKGGHSFTHIAAGGTHTCGIDADKTIRCWGSNDSGQLGTGDAKDSHLPTTVAVSTAFKAISAGRSSTCAISDVGHLYCWGANASGQTGIGAPSSTVRTPTRVQGDLAFKAVAAAYLHTCAVDTKDRAWCWGTGREAELGTGSETVYVPEFVNTKTSFASLAINFYHSCGVDTSGRAHCWGENGDGQLGVDHYVLTPTAILGPRPPEVVP